MNTESNQTESSPESSLNVRLEVNSSGLKCHFSVVEQKRISEVTKINKNNVLELIKNQGMMRSMNEYQATNRCNAKVHVFIN